MLGRMILYHFTTSPFARRVRLALAHKGLQAELRDARAEPRCLAELRGLNPLHTVPTLVDEGRVIFDSAAICHYLERKVPEPPLWPPGMGGAEAFQLTALADAAITMVVDLGMRYAPLNEHPRFASVREHLLGRAQRSLDLLADRVRGAPPGPLCGGVWSMADMAFFTLVVWFETMPARVAVFPPAQDMLQLGWTLPAALSAWADAHRNRTDVTSLD
jgi:glutathione S-transferase